MQNVCQTVVTDSTVSIISVYCFFSVCTMIAPLNINIQMEVLLDVYYKSKQYDSINYNEKEKYRKTLNSTANYIINIFQYYRMNYELKTYRIGRGSFFPVLLLIVIQCYTSSCKGKIAQLWSKLL